MTNQQQKSTTQEVKEILVSLLKVADGPADFAIIKSSSYEYIDSIYKESRTLEPSRKLKTQEEAFKTRFEDLLKEKVTSLECNGNQDIVLILKNFKLEMSFDIGDKMVTITGLEHFKFKEDGSFECTDKDYKHDEECVTLLDFWATWCGPCQGPMQHNADMLKKNAEAWQGKVKIVAISLDEEQEKLTERIIKKDWTVVDHYRMKKGWDQENKAIQLLDICGIPFIVLLDKSGRMVSNSLPHNQIEQEINKQISIDMGEVKQQQVQEKVDDQSNLLKEQFGKSKAFLRTNSKDFYTENQESKSDNYYKMNLKKSCHFDKEGRKSKQVKDKLQIEYKVSMPQKDFAMKTTEMIRSSLPSDCFNFNKELILNPQQEFKNHSKFLIALGEKYQLPIELIVKETISVTIESKELVTQDILKVTQLKNLKSNKPTDAANILEETKKYQQTNSETNIDPFNDILSEGFNFSLSVGDLYPEITNLKALGKKDDISTVSHMQGQVLVVDFCGSWMPKCVADINGIIASLKSNQDKWNGKVRFVAIDLDDEESSLQILQDNPEWIKAIDNFIITNEREITLKSFLVTYLPYYVIVDKFGRIRVLGQCSTLEKTIDDLISQEDEINESKSNADINSITDIETIKKLLSFIEKKDNFASISTILKDQLKNTLKFDLKFTRISKLHPETGNITLMKADKLVLNYSIRENQKHIIDDLINQLTAIVSKDQIILEETVNKTIDIPFGVECTLCQKTLNDQTPQYYCTFTKLHYCTDCAQSVDETQKGSKRYKVNDVLVFINAPLLDQSMINDIDEYVLGENLKLSDGEEGPQKHEMSCNGRCSNLPGPRYIAISCRRGYRQDDGYVDLCHGCFTKVIERDSEESKKIIALNENENMRVDTTYLRILFSNGYYKY